MCSVLIIICSRDHCSWAGARVMVCMYNVSGKPSLPQLYPLLLIAKLPTQANRLPCSTISVLSSTPVNAAVVMIRVGVAFTMQNFNIKSVNCMLIVRPPVLSVAPKHKLLMKMTSASPKHRTTCGSVELVASRQKMILWISATASLIIGHSRPMRVNHSMLVA